MKFRTWNFLQAYQASAMSQGALLNRANGLALVADRLRAENDALKERLRKLDAQSPVQPDAPRPGLLPQGAIATDPSRAGGPLQRFVRRPPGAADPLPDRCHALLVSLTTPSAFP